MGVRGVDEAITKGISVPMLHLNHRLAGMDINPVIFWPKLISIAAAGESDVDACRAALLSAGCSILSIDGPAAALASCFADVRAVYQERYPKLADQLVLRGRPIREQWDGYSAGLLKRISKLTHPTFLPKSVHAVLLSPYRGGDGGVDASSGRIWIEALLTNAFPEIPEVLRAVWLVAQVGLIEGLSGGTEDSQGDPWVPISRLPRVAALAMMPLTLEAACHLEMIPGPADQLSRMFPLAAQAWRIPVDDQVLDVLENWWRQFQDLQTPPPVTLKALDRMLHAGVDSASGLRR
jgi:hypothetical protein